MLLNAFSKFESSRHQQEEKQDFVNTFITLHSGISYLTLKMALRLVTRALQRNTLVSACRPISTSQSLRETFTIQDEDDFKAKVIDSSVPVIVDFSAGWCGPCKILGPRLDAAVANTNSKVNLAIVDIDENGDLALEHNVQAVPTVVAFKDGKVVDKFVGLIDEDKLDSFVTKLHS